MTSSQRGLCKAYFDSCVCYRGFIDALSVTEGMVKPMRLGGFIFNFEGFMLSS